MEAEKRQVSPHDKEKQVSPATPISRLVGLIGGW
jgi:hypothetical protein